MTMSGLCRPAREACRDVCRRCLELFPCLADPGKRASLGLKVALVLLHMVFLAAFFLFDRVLIEKTRKEPWYTATYLVLFAATLIQYFVTSFSSPGYVIDAMRAWNESNAAAWETSRTSKQSASSKSQSLCPSMNSNLIGRNARGINSNAWVKFVMDACPPGSSSRIWTCTYCNIVQPPRSKHCHDCDKCVLQFDHHCVWLGTCIGQKNHCRFWWYILEETTLCMWTLILYITLLKLTPSKPWWKETIVILLLFVLSIAFIFLILLFIFHRYGFSTLKLFLFNGENFLYFVIGSIILNSLKHQIGTLMGSQLTETSNWNIMGANSQKHQIRISNENIKWGANMMLEVIFILSQTICKINC